VKKVAGRSQCTEKLKTDNFFEPLWLFAVTIRGIPTACRHLSLSSVLPSLTFLTECFIFFMVSSLRSESFEFYRTIMYFIKRQFSIKLHSVGMNRSVENALTQQRISIPIGMLRLSFYFQDNIFFRQIQYHYEFFFVPKKLYGG